MEIRVPTEINDITLEQYQKYAVAAKDNSDEEFLLHKTISAFCEIDMKTASQFPLKDAEDIATEIHNVLNTEIPFTNRFELNGVKYGFIPNLEDLTLGEYIDLENALKDVKELHKAAAVMFRPITREYKNLYDIEAYSGSKDLIEVMKLAPLGVISAAVVFFYRLGNELLMASLASLSQAEREMQTTAERDSLLANMAGLIRSLHSVGETSLNLTALQSKTFLQLYSTSNTQKENKKLNLEDK